MRVAFVGGTGPAGVGLAARLALAGHDVRVGSRALERAEEAAARVRELAPGKAPAAGTNETIVDGADVVFLTVPPEAYLATALGLAAHLDGKVVVSIANPIRVAERTVTFEPPDEGSVAEQVQRAAPGARVVGAFREIHVKRFARLDKPIPSDTIVTSDDPEAKRVVMGLCADAGVRAVDGGPLANSRAVEHFVAVIVGINFRYRASAGLRIVGLPEG